MSAKVSHGGFGRTVNRSADESLTREDAFQLLSNDRRRFLLHHLLGQEDGAVDIRQASKQIAAWENDVDVEEVTATMRRRVYVALHQNHIPTLRSAGVVEYGDTNGDIKLADGASELRIYLEVVHEDIPWSEFYLGLGMLFLVAATLAWIDLGPFGVVPDVAWAGLASITITLVAAAHTYANRNRRLGSGSPPPEAERDR